MSFISGFIDLVSPPVCYTCGCRSYEMVCPACDGMIEAIDDPVCRICGKPGTWEKGLCPACRTERPAYDKARALAIYDFPVREAVIGMKRRSGRRLAEYLVPKIHDAFAEDLDAADIITFVPITPGRRAYRGHNQAQELAAGLAEMSGKPLIGTLRLIRGVKDQGHLAKKDRQKNIANAFSVRNKSGRLAVAIEGKSFILIDDVLTTGGTASACARVLKAAGADIVTVITLARASR